MHIVLIDPNSAVQSAMTSLLTSAGHDVEVFGDPRLALDRVKSEERIDTVITATNLTPITGIEVCREIRSIAGEQRPICVMTMTANPNGAAAHEALDVGADNVLQDPPEKRELYAKLRSGERMLAIQRRLIDLATTDPLTGLLNRRAFFERGIEICKNAEANRQVAAILLDIDYFKEVNDLYGHSVGDEALRSVAAEVAKEQPLAGRLGGDELCILLKGCSLVEAYAAAEELRARVANLAVRTVSGRTSVTCSLGVAELGQNRDIDELMRDADFALYRAKREGRDCASTPPSQFWLDQNPRQPLSIARSSHRKSLAQI
jgi:two-component system, cell cycle response regulator